VHHNPLAQVGFKAASSTSQPRLRQRPAQNLSMHPLPSESRPHSHNNNHSRHRHRTYLGTSPRIHLVRLKINRLPVSSATADRRNPIHLRRQSSGVRKRSKISRRAISLGPVHQNPVKRNPLRVCLPLRIHLRRRHNSSNL
jgi:hypothetical protein